MIRCPHRFNGEENADHDRSGSAAVAALAMLAASYTAAKAEFYRTPAGEVKYRYRDLNSRGVTTSIIRAMPIRTFGHGLPRAHR